MGKRKQMIFKKRWFDITSWPGRAQSCLIDWKGRGPVGQGVPKVALLIEKGALVRARPELPDILKRACPC